MVRIDDYLLSPAYVEVPFTVLLADSKASSAKVTRHTEENGNRKSLKEDNRQAVGKGIRQMLSSSIQDAAAVTFYW